MNRGDSSARFGLSAGGDLKDWPHEIHQKHRHASARGFLDPRWPYRIRFEYRTNGFSALAYRLAAGVFILIGK
jgi:hypothetical protein